MRLAHAIFFLIPLVIIVSWIYSHARTVRAANFNGVSPITASFYTHTSGADYFTANSSQTPVFIQNNIPAINFNPRPGNVACSNSTGVGEDTKPFTNIIQQPDGSCTTQEATQGPNEAGKGSLVEFDTVFTGTFSVSQATDVKFSFYADDGWILSIGPYSGNQPTNAGGGTPITNPPSGNTGPFTNYPVVGAWNQNSVSDVERYVNIHFPAGGIYPFEIDYFNTTPSGISFTVKADDSPFLLAPPPPSSTPTPTITPTPTPPYIISGNVFVDLNTNASKDGSETGYGSGATITLSGSASRVTTSDSAGNYSFSQLVAGNYTVRLTLPPGYSNTTALLKSVTFP